MKTHSSDLERSAAQARTGWTPAETLRLIRLYDRMLELEAAGLLGRSKAQGQTSKAELVRLYIEEGLEWAEDPRSKAVPRSKGSVESKLMNLSAVRVELGLPIVSGYKALPNMSSSTREFGTEAWGVK